MQKWVSNELWKKNIYMNIIMKNVSKYKEIIYSYSKKWDQWLYCYVIKIKILWKIIQEFNLKILFGELTEKFKL